MQRANLSFQTPWCGGPRADTCSSDDHSPHVILQQAASSKHLESEALKTWMIEPSRLRPRIKSLVRPQTLHVHVGLGKIVHEQASLDTGRNLDLWGIDIGGVGVRTHSPWQSALAAGAASHLVQSRVSEAPELRSIDFIIIRHIRPSKTSLRPSKKPAPQQTLRRARG